MAGDILCHVDILQSPVVVATTVAMWGRGRAAEASFRFLEWQEVGRWATVSACLAWCLDGVWSMSGAWLATAGHGATPASSPPLTHERHSSPGALLPLTNQTRDAWFQRRTAAYIDSRYYHPSTFCLRVRYMFHQIRKYFSFQIRQSNVLFNQITNSYIWHF